MAFHFELHSLVDSFTFVDVTESSNLTFLLGNDPGEDELDDDDDDEEDGSGSSLDEDECEEEEEERPRKKRTSKLLKQSLCSISALF